jgi:hypothetical protein
MQKLDLQGSEKWPRVCRLDARAQAWGLSVERTTLVVGRRSRRNVA